MFQASKGYIRPPTLQGSPNELAFPCRIARGKVLPVYYDTWIEIWDLTSGEVTTRAVFDQRFEGFIGPGLVGHVEYVGSDVVYHVYRLEVSDGSM